MKESENVESIVKEWNSTLGEQDIEDVFFVYQSSGFVEAVSFGDYVFWNSEDYISDEYGDESERSVRESLIAAFEKYQTLIKTIKLK